MAPRPAAVAVQGMSWASDEQLWLELRCLCSSVGHNDASRRSPVPADAVSQRHRGVITGSRGANHCRDAAASAHSPAVSSGNATAAKYCHHAAACQPARPDSQRWLHRRAFSGIMESCSCSCTAWPDHLIAVPLRHQTVLLQRADSLWS